MSELHDAALNYLYEGFQVFPLWPGGKTPLVENGLHEATDNPTTVDKWWGRWPQANIGVRVPERVIVIDIDPRSGGALDQLGNIPRTRTAATGGGGWHLLFRHVGRARGKLDEARGIDIKTNSGYIVGAPSVHESGRRYRWTDRGPIADLPASLLRRVSPAPPQVVWDDPGVGSTKGLVATVADAVEGERNHKFFWAACRAYQEGADPELMGALVNAARSIGLTEREIGLSLRSAQARV
ncbi:DNA polymerase/primase [Gordonia phage Neville]|uniref:DNA primase/polymerase n=2 Tax=Nevillevirus TaxID=3044773 RepID=A0A515MH29_9CAUD|nr:DNA polymerase/primase [Gordonia phage Neville]YP_010246081.1 DNA polymerase/primase [Gordonia phage Trax]AXQ64458.1 DNA primase/polymerase [Gordonia phage Neville]QDM55983.1 DNA primase/polymerase [Gordonia phage Trax]